MNWFLQMNEKDKNSLIHYISTLIVDELVKLSMKHQYVEYSGREPSASPATGLAQQHKEEQEKLIKKALGI